MIIVLQNLEVKGEPVEEKMRNRKQSSHRVYNNGRHKYKNNKPGDSNENRKCTGDKDTNRAENRIVSRDH